MHSVTHVVGTDTEYGYAIGVVPSSDAEKNARRSVLLWRMPLTATSIAFWYGVLCSLLSFYPGICDKATRRY